MKVLRLSGYVFLLSFLWIACSEGHYTPKPRAYFRIDFPEKVYQTYQDSCPFQFDYPTYARIVTYTEGNNYCWFNMDFPGQGARVHFSYFRVNDNLNEHLENSRTLAYKHTVKANEIIEELHMNSDDRVFAHHYSIRGNTASSSQFYITDSTTHFLRGALYFSCFPNSDSLQPSIDFVQADILRLIESFKWK
jgi:gliding motility-associated lipoprotein GldD